MAKPNRVTFLRNGEPYSSYIEAITALNRYAEANALLDGEPVLGRYYTETGTIETVLAVCTVIHSSESGCADTEKLTFFVSREELNKDLSKVAFTGQYDDLLGLPTINGVEIKDVITLSDLGFKDVAWTGDYNDLDNVPTKLSEFDNDVGYITNANVVHKADKVDGAINGNLAGLDENGNLTDSGLSENEVRNSVSESHTHNNKSILDEIPSSLGNPRQALVVNPQGNGLVWEDAASAVSNLTDVSLTNISDGQILKYDSSVSKWVNTEETQSDWSQTNQSKADYIKNKPNLATVATTGNYNDLTNIPQIPSAPGVLNTDNTNTQTVNSNESLAGNIKLHKVSKTGSYNDLLNKPTIPTALSQLSEDTTHRLVTDTEKTTWNGKSVVSVSDSGTSTTQAKYLTVNGTEYKLASDAPIENISVGGRNVTITNRVAQIPSADSTHEGTLTASDYVSFSGKYTKPANGIPESDLDSAVQTSLGKADTALQPSAISDMQTKSNKVNAWQNTPDNDHYPSEKLVKDSLDNKQNNLAAQTAYTSQGTSTKVPQITTNTLGQVTGITEVSIDFPTIPSGSVTGSATSFVKDVTLSGHTLSGNTQTADSSIDENSASLPTSQAVRSFVNSSISNMAAYYMTKNAAGDPFDSNAELMAATTFYSGGVAKVPTLNDYTIVVHDETQAIEVPGYSSFASKHDYIGYYVLISNVYTLVTDSNYNTLVFTPGTDKAYELPSTRYINTSSTTTPSWSYQYIINNTGLTASQIAAVNSGINAGKVSAYDTHIADTTIHVTSTDKTNWNAKLDPVTAVNDDTSKNYVSAVTQSTSGQISVSKGTLATVATSGSYNDLTNKPSIPAAQVNSDWNASSGLAEILNKPTLAAVATSGSYNDLTDTPTIPATSVLYTSQTLTAEQQAQARANIGAGASGFSGDYTDLTNKPVLNTDNTTAQSTSANETINGTINLHKVSKTGTYSDLIGTPSLATVATSGSYNDLIDKPSIPAAPGTLNTTATTAQSTSSNEALSGNVTLHKISKTGTYSDLIGTPSLATVATSGSFNDLTDKPTIPADLDDLSDVTITSATNGQVLTYDGTNSVWKNQDALYVPKVQSTDNAVARFDGTTGDIQNSGVIIDDSNNIKIPTIGEVSAYQNPKLEIGEKVWIGTGSSGGIVMGGISNSTYATYYTFDPTSLRVTTANTGLINLGTSSQKWKNIYLTGDIYGTSSNISVDTLISNSHTHSNKSILDDIPSSLGTAGQALVVNSGANGLEWATVGGGGGGDTVTGKTVTLGTTGTAVIQVNGVDAGSVSLPSGSTSAAGIVQLTDSTSSTSTTTAATPNSVKSAYDLASGAIPKSTGTTGGDIIYFTGASTPTRLAKGAAGQVLTMNSGATAPEWQTPSGGGGLTDYNFTHVANTTVTSPFTFTCAANQRNSQMITTGANLTLNITCNNGSDNYLWIKNSSSSADIDIAIGTVTYNGTTLSSSAIYLPSDGISVPKSGLCEIGIIMNADGAFITVRSDLAPSA